jgi:hypothetical protein
VNKRIKKISTRLLYFMGILTLSGCFGSADREPLSDPEDIFFDYKIWGEEGNDSVMVMLQFREYDAFGETILVDEPGSVILDGQKIKADSTPMTGPFYAVYRHVRDFTGRHSIVYTDINRNKYKEDFVFSPFTLKTELGDTVARNRLNLVFEGLNKRDIIRILLTDTSFTSDGINRVDTVWNNKLTLTRGDLLSLENGPINLEFIRETERRVSNSTAAGGTLSILYTIRREIFLKD